MVSTNLLRRVGAWGKDKAGWPGLIVAVLVALAVQLYVQRKLTALLREDD
ncbi:MAG: hypothetical protein ABEJ44_01960 [Halanaeroarchaeum sp.]